MTSEPFHVEGIDVNQQPPEEPAPIFETAFVCYVSPEGHWMVTPELHNAAGMQIKRVATPDDFYHAVCMIKKDVETWETAHKAVQLHQQAMQATIEAATQRKVAEQPRTDGGAIDLSKLRQ